MDGKYRIFFIFALVLTLGLSRGNWLYAEEDEEESISAAAYEVKEGLEAYIKEDYDGAAEQFKKAMLLEPWNKKARQYLEELGLSDFVKKVGSDRPVTRKYNAIKDLRKVEEKIKVMEIQLARAGEKMKELEAQRAQQEAKMKELEAKKKQEAERLRQLELNIDKMRHQKPKKDAQVEWLKKKLEDLEKED